MLADSPHENGSERRRKPLPTLPAPREPAPSAELTASAPTTAKPRDASRSKGNERPRKPLPVPIGPAPSARLAALALNEVPRVFGEVDSSSEASASVPDAGLGPSETAATRQIIDDLFVFKNMPGHPPITDLIIQMPDLTLPGGGTSFALQQRLLMAIQPTDSGSDDGYDSDDKTRHERASFPEMLLRKMQCSDPAMCMHFDASAGEEWDAIDLAFFFENAVARIPDFALYRAIKYLPDAYADSKLSLVGRLALLAFACEQDTHLNYLDLLQHLLDIFFALTLHDHGKEEVSNAGEYSDTLIAAVITTVQDEPHAFDALQTMFELHNATTAGHYGNAFAMANEDQIMDPAYNLITKAFNLQLEFDNILRVLKLTQEIEGIFAAKSLIKDGKLHEATSDASTMFIHTTAMQTNTVNSLAEATYACISFSKSASGDAEEAELKASILTAITALSNTGPDEFNNAEHVFASGLLGQVLRMWPQLHPDDTPETTPLAVLSLIRDAFTEIRSADFKKSAEIRKLTVTRQASLSDDFLVLDGAKIVSNAACEALDCPPESSDALRHLIFSLAKVHPEVTSAACSKMPLNVIACDEPSSLFSWKSLFGTKPKTTRRQLYPERAGWPGRSPLRRSSVEERHAPAPHEHTPYTRTVSANHVSSPPMQGRGHKNHQYDSDDDLPLAHPHSERQRTALDTPPNSASYTKASLFSVPRPNSAEAFPPPRAASFLDRMRRLTSSSSRPQSPRTDDECNAPQDHRLRCASDPTGDSPEAYSFGEAFSQSYS